MPNKIRFGLIGCGRIAPKHINAIKQLSGDAELKAVCDIDKERAIKFATENNCDFYTDYKELIKRDDIDLISICTPHHLHSDMAIDAANAKKNIILEKPMAMFLNEADKMIEECKKNNIKLFVVKQNRYNPPIRKLKEAVDQGRFGKLFLGNVSVRWYRPQSYYDADPWKGTKDQDGGILMNQALHHVDLLQWLMGPAESVIGKAGTMTHKIDSDDTALAIIKFKSGALGVIEATTCVYPKNIEGSIALFGDSGSAKVGGHAVNKMDHWDFKDFRNDDVLINQFSTNPTDVYGYGHLEFYKEVIGAIKSGKEHNIDGSEARKSLELVSAIYKAVETGQEIKLPLKE